MYLPGEKAVVGRSSRLHSRSNGRVAPPYHAKKVYKKSFVFLQIIWEISHKNGVMGESATNNVIYCICRTNGLDVEKLIDF
jgi:hypothetical protein